MKIYGVSMWIWAICLAVFWGAVLAGLPLLGLSAGKAPAALEIVNDDLWKSAGAVEVRGKIFNPRPKAARNITIHYDLVVTDVKTGSKNSTPSAVAEIRYLPPGQTLDFEARSKHRLGKWEVVEKSEAEVMEAP